MNLSASRGIAVREFPLNTGFADYLLYADGKAIGVVEAKKQGHGVIGAEQQSAKYREGLPAGIPNWGNPLPFAYETTGAVTRFTNCLEVNARSREVFTFHRPEELIRLAGLDQQVRTRLALSQPPIEGRLWDVQRETIENLERSLAENRPRSLIRMATGSGKTFTAVNACYRLIRNAGAKRILFLCDRNNLCNQTLNEFQKYQSPYTGYKFVEEYEVQHLKGKSISPSSKVCISTIQRVFSILANRELDDTGEDLSAFELDPSLGAPVDVTYNPDFPIETFDFIVVDEAHRSIYNLWRQVLDYFDATMVGLTATPTNQTLGFFNGNLVQDYGHERAIIDRVNVGFDVYRIETQVTKEGATLVKEPELVVPVRDRRTKETRYRELDEDLPYTASDLDRDVVSLNQIRLVIQTWRDRLVEIFPDRSEVPKTLFFAKTDQHAEDIVEILREEFGKGNDFAQKITSKSTGKKPEDLLRDFRSSYLPRIAVTVDMIATGTDVKALECLVFMRNIKSSAYFDQMKGRGCRVVSPDELQSVTPDAKAKTRFVIVDCVGVCESDKTTTKPLDRKPTVPLDKILGLVAQGVSDGDLASTLASRLARMDLELNESQEQEIRSASGGMSLAALGARLLESIDPDRLHEIAAQTLGTSTPTEEQIAKIEQEQVREALKPFHNPRLREAILTARSSLEQVVDDQTPDQLIRAGFDAAAMDKAREMVTSFRKFVEANRDEIEAIKILYSRPYREHLRYRHVKDLAAKLGKPPFYIDPARPESVLRLWSAYEVVEGKAVKGKGGTKLVDLIALVRHAIDPRSPIAPVGMTVEQRYQEWIAEKAAQGVQFTADQRRWLDAIKDHIGSSLAIEQDDLEEVPFNTIGGLGRAHELFGDRLKPLLEELNARLAA
jgi:type I restriction enzyme R subunit